MSIINTYGHVIRRTINTLIHLIMSIINTYIHVIRRTISTSVGVGTYGIGSCKANNHTITPWTAPATMSEQF